MSLSFSNYGVLNQAETALERMKAIEAERSVFGYSVLAGETKDSVKFTTKTNKSSKSPKIKSDDDGKISFKEKVVNFGKGVVAPIKTMFSSPKNIALTALTTVAGIGLVALTGGAAAPVLVAAGVIGGGVQIGKGIYNQSKATTDEQARQAWQQMGSGTFTVGVSVAGAKSALKASGTTNVKGMSPIKATAKCVVSSPKHLVNGVKTASVNISNFVSGIKPKYSEVNLNPDSPETIVPDAPDSVISDTPDAVIVETQETPVVDVPEESFVNADISESVPVVETDVPKLPAGKKPLALPPPVNKQDVSVVDVETSVVGKSPETTTVNIQNTPKALSAPKELLLLPEVETTNSALIPTSGETSLVPVKPKNTQVITTEVGNIVKKQSFTDKLRNFFAMFGLCKPAD